MAFSSSPLHQAVRGAALAAVLAGAFACKTPASSNESSASQTGALTAGADLARGRYLGEVVLGCVGCHTERDFSKVKGPFVGPVGAGYCFDAFKEIWNLEHRLCAPNITSDKEFGVGGWRDEELARAIREGRSKDGRVLLPHMPWPDFQILSDKDTAAVVAWVRTLPAAHVNSPRTEIPAGWREGLEQEFGAKAKLQGPVEGPKDDPVSRGHYLSVLAQCARCHHAHGGDELSGGDPIPTLQGMETPANLTPHEQGLKSYSAEQFVARFRAISQLPAEAAVKGANNHQAMPWVTLQGLTDADLNDLYAYFRSLPPSPTSSN